MKSAIYDKIILVLEKKFGGNMTLMAEPLGVSPQAVQQWIACTTAPRSKSAAQIVQWAGEIEGVEVVRTSSSAILPYVDIPRLDVSASAGLGLDRPDADAVIEMIRVTRAWLSAHVTAPHDSLAIITARGDSMEPAFRDGDLLLVDTSAVLDRDAVFVFAINGQLYMKRLQRKPDGTITAISDNKERYEPFVISASTPDLHIIGRIVCVWKNERL